MIEPTYFDRFETKKYASKNPVQRALIGRFASMIHELFLEAQPAATVLEVGVGEGFLSGWLSERFPEKAFTGVEINPDDLARLRPKFPRIRAVEGSAYDLGGVGGPFDLVLCCEVLEHLDDPARALRELRQQTRGHAILSVPHEPFFMGSNFLRGKNVSRWGNDPEHVNHWGRSAFRAFVETEFTVVRMATAFPWVAALVRPR